MVVNIRGTFGSGKSTVVTKIMERYHAVPYDTDDKDRPLNYVMNISGGKKLFVVGSYRTACGGCDGIQPYALIWPRVVKFAKLGHVLFEGALISSSYGNIGRASEAFGDEFVFAFMNTPLEVCLERIRKRREAKGNTKPVDPKNVASKIKTIAKSIQVATEKHRRIVIVNYKNPVPQILGILYSNSGKEGEI